MTLPVGGGEKSPAWFAGRAKPKGPPPPGGDRLRELCRWRLSMSLPHANRRSRKPVQDNALLAVVMPERQDTGRTLLHTGGTAHALRVLHRQTFVREVHDVDSLVADRSADVARNAFRFLRENPEPGKPRIDVHERGKRTEESAPDAAGVFKIKADADDAAEENIDVPFVDEIGSQQPA